MSTTKINISMLKEPTLWRQLQDKLNLSEDKFSHYFEYGDYGEIEIEVDENLNIISGKFVPCGEGS